MSDSSLKTRLAFHIWRALLLISLGTFVLGLSAHVLTLISAPWLSLQTQATIHAAIPVLLTAVKFVTVPLLLLLTPFARHHETFESWESWGKASFHRLEEIVKIPWNLAKGLFSTREVHPLATQEEAGMQEGGLTISAGEAMLPLSGSLRWLSALAGFALFAALIATALLVSFSPAPSGELIGAFALILAAFLFWLFWLPPRRERSQASIVWTFLILVLVIGGLAAILTEPI
jgi:hypothetical protein